jgi:hypothetical protein
MRVEILRIFSFNCFSLSNIFVLKVNWVLIVAKYVCNMVTIGVVCHFNYYFKIQVIIIFFIVIMCVSIHFVCLCVTLFLLQFFGLFTHHVNEGEMNYCCRDY